jgi:hypothetical protein
MTTTETTTTETPSSRRPYVRRGESSLRPDSLPSPASRSSHGCSPPAHRPRSTQSHQSRPQLCRNKQRRRRVRRVRFRTRTVSTVQQGTPSSARTAPSSACRRRPHRPTLVTPSSARTAPPCAFCRRPNHRRVTSSSARTAPSCARSPTSYGWLTVTAPAPSLTASGVDWHRDPQGGNSTEVEPNRIGRTDQPHQHVRAMRTAPNQPGLGAVHLEGCHLGRRTTAAASADRRGQLDREHLREWTRERVAVVHRNAVCLLIHLIATS